MSNSLGKIGNLLARFGPRTDASELSRLQSASAESSRAVHLKSPIVNRALWHRAHAKIAPQCVFVDISERERQFQSRLEQPAFTRACPVVTPGKGRKGTGHFSIDRCAAVCWKRFPNDLNFKSFKPFKTLCNRIRSFNGSTVKMVNVNGPFKR